MKDSAYDRVKEARQDALEMIGNEFYSNGDRYIAAALLAQALLRERKQDGS